jgi:hypothetical protein
MMTISSRSGVAPAEVIDIEAASYRLKEAKELTAARTKRQTKKPPAS